MRSRLLIPVFLVPLLSFLGLLFAKCSSGLLPLGAEGRLLQFTGIRSFSAEPDNVILRWEPITEATSYLLYRIESGTPTEIDTANSGASSATITGLTPATTYVFRVRAADSTRKTDTNTNDVTVTTPGSSPPSAILSADGSLIAWFKANAGIEKNEANRISAWRDQSGQHNDVEQPAVLSQPVWLNNAVNGLPAVNHGDANSTLEASGFLFAGAGRPHTLIMAFKVTSSSPIARSFFSDLSDNGLGYGLAPNNLGVMGGAAPQESNLTFDIDSFAIATFSATEQSGGNINVRIWRNGKAASETLTQVNSGTSGGVVLGKDGGCQFAEILLYNKQLSDSERQPVEVYLSNRYNIALEGR